MNLFYPRFPWRLLPRMLCIAVLGALVGGIYGILHDQVTYSISHEYFTNLKFDQFRYANFGFPVRIFVSEVGFLATWWVGLFAAWFLARIAVPSWPKALAFRRCLQGFAIIFVSGITAGIVGYLLGVQRTANYSNWQDLCDTLGVTDVPAFVRVAYIHNASYLGGVIGLVIAILFLCYLKRTERGSASPPTTAPHLPVVQ